MAESAALGGTGPAGAEADDAGLVGRVTAGDREAFEALYARYLPRVYGYVRRRVYNQADIEEAVQDVFVAVFSSLESFRGDAPFAAWVLGVAKRTVANRFKRRSHPTVPLELENESEWIDLPLSSCPHMATPLEQYECRERIQHIERTAARELTAEQWRMFELHHLEHQSIQSIASTTNKSKDAVKSNLYRVRRVLMR
jgi:RNA polymerase sigma-70 factor (ECF subfamily)